MFGPLIKGEHVTLRPPTPEDAACFVRWFADMEVTRYLGHRTGVSLQQEEEFFKKIGESKDDLFWVIEAEGKSIGATGIHRIDWLSAHGTTGIVIGEKDCWRKGYASEVMALRTRYAFRELNLHKLVTEAFEENAASRRALAKVGYKEIGRRREHFFTRGRWHDVWLAEVLRSDWEKRATSPKG